MDNVERFIRTNALRLATEAGITDAATRNTICRQALLNYRRNWGGGC